MGEAVEEGCEQSGIAGLHPYDVAQNAMEQYGSPNVCGYEKHCHKEDGEVEFGLRHQPMVYPVHRQEHCHEERMAQGVPVKPHARYEYQREDVIARHAEMVVKDRPEPYTCTACERVVMTIDEQTVQYGEDDGG